jgi:branched-subunit amino acid aminotransferase/4-amino-4-deoxychorismate lyase
MATQAELLAQIAKLQADNEALKAAKVRPISFKVGEKGGVSVYGLNSQFPVTLYKEQWERLLGHTEQLKAFIAANEANLKVKQVK